MLDIGLKSGNIINFECDNEEEIMNRFKNYNWWNKPKVITGNNLVTGFDRVEFIKKSEWIECYCFIGGEIIKRKILDKLIDLIVSCKFPFKYRYVEDNKIVIEINGCEYFLDIYKKND